MTGINRAIKQVDDGSFAAVSCFEADLNIRHKTIKGDECRELICAYHKAINPSEFVDDEYVNRFEPVLSDLRHSEEELYRFTKEIGVADDSGMVLYNVRNILNNYSWGPDEEIRDNVGKLKPIFDGLIAELMSTFRKNDDLAVDNEDELKATARAYLLLMLNGYVNTEVSDSLDDTFNVFADMPDDMKDRLAKGKSDARTSQLDRVYDRVSNK